jgi:ABC-type oligopeptide transport system ATPase subunit
MSIIKCSDISKSFPVARGYLRSNALTVKAVDGVSFNINRGEVFGLVGESGCGKTTVGRMVLGVIKPDSGRIERQTDRFQAVFQDPYGSLDPRMRISDILAEGLVIRSEADGQRPDINRRVEGSLDLVKLPKTALGKYPHQFSGGERQRIAIARAIITEPDLIVCDEPVSSLDVTIQLNILNLLKDIRKRLDITYLFISHDLRVIRYMCDRVAVMRQGRIVEEAAADLIYDNPAHPYTKTLLSSVPDINILTGKR